MYLYSRYVLIGSPLNFHTLPFFALSPPFCPALRVYEWVFTHAHSEDLADPVKAVFIRGLHEVLSSDSAKSQGPLMQVCLLCNNLRTLGFRTPQFPSSLPPSFFLLLCAHSLLSPLSLTPLIHSFFSFSSPPSPPSPPLTHSFSSFSSSFSFQHLTTRVTCSVYTLDTTPNVTTSLLLYIGPPFLSPSLPAASSAPPGGSSWYWRWKQCSGAGDSYTLFISPLR